MADLEECELPFQGVNVPGLEKRGKGLRSWVRIDTSGNSQVIEVEKYTMMKRCDLPARDLRLLDPLIVYPSIILGREKAIVVKLEQIRCIITADEVLLLDSLDSTVLQYVADLQTRLQAGADVGQVWYYSDSDNNLPFEFRALEVALEVTCSSLHSKVDELEIEAYPLLDTLAEKISSRNLEQARTLKSRLVELTRRIQKVRDEIEQLMDDDADMAEMYLTQKKNRLESSFHGDQPLFGYRANAVSVSAPVSPVSSPPNNRTLKTERSRHERVKSSESVTNSTEELEMLLDSYLGVTHNHLNKLISLRDYIDDTEDYINMHLDKVCVELIRVELLFTTATFIVAIFGVVTATFSMNFELPIYKDPKAFKWVLIITGACGAVIFGAFLLFFKHKRLMSGG